MKYFILYIAILLSFFSNAQELISSASVSTFNTAGQGDLYVDENNVYYIGLEDGGLKEIGIITERGTTDGQVLRWSTSQQNWLASNPSTGSLSFEKDILYYSNKARVKFEPILSLNGNSNDLIPEQFFYNSTTANITTLGINGLDGNLRFWVQLNFQSNEQRTNFNLVLKVNGAEYKRVYGSAYARNGGNNHNQTSARYIYEYENATSTDEFSFELEREANNGNNVELRSSAFISSQVLIEAYQFDEVLTELSSPPELRLVQGPTGISGPQGPQGPQGPTVGEPTDVYHAAGKVEDTGFGVYIQGATVSRLSQGRYQVVFDQPHPNGADYPVIFSMEQNLGKDDYVPAYNNVTANGFNVEIGEQDNGGTGGVPSDSGFSFYVPLSI